MNTFNIQEYTNTISQFPTISYNQYETITDKTIRAHIAKQNTILKTDAYNRTMAHTKWEKRNDIETLTLTLRKNAWETFNIIYGIKDKIIELFSKPISQHMLDFAADFYANQKNRKWNNAFVKQMWQEVIDKHNWFIPVSIKAVADGTALHAWEPVLSISWPSELAAIYEAVLLRCSFESNVATDALILNQLMHDGRVAECLWADEFWARSAINWDHHFAAAEALIVWWWLQATSSDITALVYPQLRTSGTIAHRFLAAYPTEDEAFISAIENNDKISLLVDLIDSYDGIEKAIALKKKYRDSGKKIGIRLDSGNLLDQALYALKRFSEEWLTNPELDKIIIADVSSISDIARIEKAVVDAWFNPRDFIYYGIGELLIGKNKGRSRNSAALKLTKTNGRNTGKRSNDAGKVPIPGELNIEIRDNERVIVQEDEPVQWKRLLNTVYENGTIYYNRNDITYVDEARKNLIENFADIFKPTTLSEKTQEVIVEVQNWFDWQSLSTTKRA